MVKSLIDIFIYIFEAFILWYYCDNAFKTKYKRGVSMLCILAAYALLYGVCQLRMEVLNGVTTALAIALIMVFLYGEKIINAIIHTLLFYSLLVASEYVTLPIIALIFGENFSAYKTNDSFYFYAALFSKLLHFVFVLLLLAVYKKLKTKESIKGFALIIVIPVSNIAILTVFEFLSAKAPASNEIYLLWVFVAALLLLSSFLVFFNRSNIIRQSERINELNIENQKKELDEQYFSVLEKSNDDMQILAHDFKNHLSYVRHLDSAEEKDIYIDKIYPEIEKFQQTASTGNKTLDVILSKYTSICELKAVSFKADVKNANLSQVESVDLIALLNNLLDNAVEAAETSESKRITLTLVKDTQFMDKLVIANSCDTAPAQSGGKLLTRKKEGAFHGTGLKSVKKVCDRYGANYTWEYDSEEYLFITTVLMPREQKND